MLSFPFAEWKSKVSRLAVDFDQKSKIICSRDNCQNVSSLEWSPMKLNGAYNRNPFLFQPFNLSKLDVSCDGQSIYGKPFEPKFESDNYLRSYMSYIYQALGNQFQSCNIDYKAGYCFWGYDLTPDQGADQGHLHPIKTANLRLELQFARALESTINVIVDAQSLIIA